jgi:hypothetical protein
MKVVILAFFALLLVACNSEQTNSQTDIGLHPISPVTYAFKDPAPEVKLLNRADFFYSDTKIDLTAKSQKALFEHVKTQKNKITANYNALSIYVYKKTDKLNETYKGNFDDLKGVHDNDLISYTRWVNGNMDIFYIIKDGNVVYDMVENASVTPPFEFN